MNVSLPVSSYRVAQASPPNRVSMYFLKVISFICKSVSCKLLFLLFRCSFCKLIADLLSLIDD